MRVNLACLVAMAAGIGSTAYAQQIAAVPATSATQPVLSAHGAIEPGNYPIGIKDSLAIDVFDVPSLSQTVEVDSTGCINLPLIGQVQAAGLTPNQLSHAI